MKSSERWNKIKKRSIITAFVRKNGRVSMNLFDKLEMVERIRREAERGGLDGVLV